MVLEWTDHQTHCAFPFKFNQSWLENNDFIHIVRSEWPRILSNPSLDVMQDFYDRLRILKEKVKSWTKVETLKMKDKSADLEKEISSILLASHSAILNQDQQQKLNSLKKDLQRLIEHDINSARLQSRITWA